MTKAPGTFKPWTVEAVARPAQSDADEPLRFPGSGELRSDPPYESRMRAGLAPRGAEAAAENPIPEERLDRIYPTSSEEMAELPDGSVHLMITSPPYNARKEYDQDLSLDEYRDLLRRVFRETYRVLVSGGRACVNVANLGRKPYIPLHAYVIADMLDLGYLMRGESSGTAAAAPVGRPRRSWRRRPTLSCATCTSTFWSSKESSPGGLTGTPPRSAGELHLTKSV
jgi:hypothetical protein